MGVPRTQPTSSLLSPPRPPGGHYAPFTQEGTEVWSGQAKVHSMDVSPGPPLRSPSDLPVTGCGCWAQGPLGSWPRITCCVFIRQSRTHLAHSH